MNDRAKRTIVSHWVFVKDKAWARVNLNGIPLYRTPHVGPDSRSGPVNYAVRPGENVLEVELLRTGPKDDGDHQRNAVIVQLYTVNNLDAPETEKLDRNILLDVRYPEIWHAAAERHRHFPFYHRQVFQIDEGIGVPAFMQAPPASFGCDGTPELCATVARIYRLLETRDYEGLLAELAFKFQCDELALAGHDDRLAGARMQLWRDELFAFEPRPTAPLDLGSLHFEPRCEGRVAYVTRIDEGYVLDAVCDRDPKRRIRTDLLLTQHQGRWRVCA
jgi:hypothetical protein